MISHCNKLTGYLKCVPALSLSEEILEKQRSQTTCPVSCWKTIHPCLFCRFLCVMITKGHWFLPAGMWASPGGAQHDNSIFFPSMTALSSSVSRNQHACAVCALELHPVPQIPVSPPSHLYLLGTSLNFLQLSFFQMCQQQ